MEKFKACEREMKTKQYSKEGLQAKEKLDPAEVAKMDAGHWITSTVDKLTTLYDALEAESEQIKVAKSRKVSKADAERLKIIAHNLDRHKFHMQKLETMLRMLENDALTPDDVCFDN
jgi:CCR4-NOT transcription complex subunit 3